MMNKALEIQIYFEIAMAIGTSLDLHKMLRTALSAYLRKLSCATGAVLELHSADGRYRYLPCFSIPRNAVGNVVYRAILQQLPEQFSSRELSAFINTLPLKGSVNDRHHFYFTLLPDFGLLLLIKSGQPLDFRILHSLRQLNGKLADSCIACRQNTRIAEINARLSNEILQRQAVENTLKELLGSLEEQVAERTRALRNSESRYKALFDNIQDIFFSLAVDGSIEEISPSVETTLHYPRSSLLGRSVQSLGFSQKAVSAFLRKIQRDGLVKDYTLIIRAGDKTIHHFSMNAILTDDGGTHPLRIIGSLRDITQQHRVEKSKRLLEEQLHNSRKMEALGLLAGGVAHDLNNVLSGIVSYPDLLLTMIEHDSNLAIPLKTIRDSGEKAAAIVQDLLTMARRGVIHKEVINLNYIIAEYLTSPEHRKVIESHRSLRITTDLQAELLNVEGSALHLRNAIMNLVLNGAEAGADRIIIATENTSLKENRYADRLFPEGEYVTLRVTDNGTGISHEDQQRIFEPFYTKKVMGRSGTGLGMSVVWGTAQDHNGHITIDSDPGRATTFTLLLPGSRKQPLKRTEHEPQEEYGGKGESVLLIDDSDSQRQIARAILQALNYSVRTAASGEEAIEMLQHPGFTPDILILDMIMEGGMDGLDTYRLIREKRPELKVIIASGYSETERVKEALLLGASMYIRKPYLLKTIGKALRQCLESADRSSAG